MPARSETMKIAIHACKQIATGCRISVFFPSPEGDLAYLRNAVKEKWVVSEPKSREGGIKDVWVAITGPTLKDKGPTPKELRDCIKDDPSFDFPESVLETGR